MLRRVLIFAAVLACAFATDEDTGAERGPEQSTAQFNGQQFEQAVEMHDHVAEDASQNCFRVEEDKLQYILYTRENPNGEVVVSNPLNLSDSSMNVKKPLKVIAHSWLQNKTWVIPVVRDYLYSQNVDVLVVDWSAYSKKCNIETTSIYVTPFVGESLSFLLKQIIGIGQSGRRMHLIGFSHGAHIVGIAGRLMAPHLPNRISALDPLRLNEIDQPGVRKLTGGDAKFIDVIVTSLPGLSFEYEIGDVTFYPNGGFTKYQGKCDDKTNEMDKMLCGHALAYKLFSESLVSPKKFPAVRCESYSKFLAGHCNGEAQSHMGEYVEKNARGRYFLQINKNYPYDKGLTLPKQLSA